jgi:hypothetical protein
VGEGGREGTEWEDVGAVLDELQHEALDREGVGPRPADGTSGPEAEGSLLDQVSGSSGLQRGG